MRTWCESEVKGTVRSFLRHLATSGVWASYSLRGVRGKNSFDGLKVYKLVQGKFFFPF